jgi:hypothetical protein
MSHYYRSLIQGSSLLLDLYPNAAVAYSLRKLRDAYSGSPIKVRRSFDNTDQDIGFDSNGELDISSLNSFFGNNLLLQSEDFNTSWTKAQITVGTGVISAPVGGGNADKLQETAVNNVHTLTQASGTINSSSNYFLSVYLKEAERNIVDLVSGIAGSSQVLRINLTTGGVVSNNFANSPTITSVGSGWFKIELVVPSAVTSTPTGFQVRLTNGSTQTYLGTAGSGCYIWGAQISGYSGSVVPYFKTTTLRANEAFVSIWYDQSGNANHSTQTTPANQASIVLNGFLIRDALSKPTTTWTADRYTLSPGINPNTRYLSIGVVNRTSNAGGISQLGVASAIGGLNGQEPLYWAATTGAIRSDMYTAVTHGTNTSTGNFIMTSEKNASNLKTVYLNGSALPTTATEAPGAGNNMNIWGFPNSNPTTCQYQEYMYWNSEQSANRVAIETLINDYYGIF